MSHPNIHLYSTILQKYGCSYTEVLLVLQYLKDTDNLDNIEEELFQAYQKYLRERNG